MIKIDTFKLKDGRVVEIVLPSTKGLKSLTDFVNRLIKEDTYLNFTGAPTSIYFQKSYIKNALIEIDKGKSAVFWATFEGNVIGSVDVRLGGPRDYHVGTIGLYIDKDFRRQGLGKYLLNEIINKAKLMGIDIVTLNIFAENLPAKVLYEKAGFKEWGRLPRGLYRKNKYSDKVEMYKNL